MESKRFPTIDEVRSLITVEVACAGGTVIDHVEPEGYLYLRALLPQAQEIRPGDRLTGGLAARVTPRDVLVCPYVYRQVCSNGAVISVSDQAHTVDRVESEADCVDARLSLQKAVEACLTTNTFTTMIQRIKPVTTLPADLSMFLTLVRNRFSFSDAIWSQIIRHFRREEEDRSMFAVMNAVTATARDTADPHQRWDLEALGGAVPALLIPPQSYGGGKAAPAEPHTLSGRFSG